MCVCVRVYVCIHRVVVQALGACERYIEASLSRLPATVYTNQ